MADLKFTFVFGNRHQEDVNEQRNMKAYELLHGSGTSHRLRVRLGYDANRFYNSISGEVSKYIESTGLDESFFEVTFVNPSVSVRVHYLYLEHWKLRREMPYLSFDRLKDSDSPGVVVTNTQTKDLKTWNYETSNS